MNRQTAIRKLFYFTTLICLAFALPISYDVAKASDEVGSLSLWLPSAHSGKPNTGGENPTPETPTVTPETPTVTPTVTPETPTVTPTVTPETPTVTPTPDTDPEPWANFADPQWNTNSASIAIDANGGLHRAYHYYESVFDGAPTSGVYQYCPSDCDKAANWAGVTLGANVNEIQLELTTDGHPRLLYRVSTNDTGNVFYYAECNQNCTQAAGWNGAAVFSNRGVAPFELNIDEQPQRYFELDPENRPRFIYDDYDSFREPDHVGTYYAFCDSGCTAASNWSEVRINKDNGGVGPYRSEKFHYPVLAFSPTGQPRVLADGTTMQDESLLHFVSCDSACDNPDNWHSTPLWERGSGNNVAYDIEINAQGQPRVAYYDGARLGGEGEWLYYGWCNQACTVGTNWQRFDMGFVAREGQEPDLMLDAAGKPHIAFAVYSTGGMAYSRCENNCESANAQWTTVGVESANDLATAWNVAIPQHCDGGVWTALTPVLALDKDGNPYFAYDATYYARCWYNDVTKTWDPFHQFHLVVRTVRTFFLPKP